MHSDILQKEVRFLLIFKRKVKKLSLTIFRIRNFLFSFGNDYILIIFLSFLILFEKSKIYKIFFDIKNNFHILIHIFTFIILIFFSIIFSSILPIFAAKYFIVFLKYPFIINLIKTTIKVQVLVCL